MDFSQMTAAHLLFIPSVLLIGLVAGYTLGARAVRTEIERQRKRLKE